MKNIGMSYLRRPQAPFDEAEFCPSTKSPVHLVPVVLNGEKMSI